MNKKIKLTEFSDGGHAWVSVKRKLLDELGILKEISSCSYQKGESVYLEEDCDYPRFLYAYFKTKDLPSDWRDHFEIKESYSDVSPIRSYERFNPNPIPVLKVGDQFRLYDESIFKVEYMKGKDYICTRDNYTGLYKIKRGQVREAKVIA